MKRFRYFFGCYIFSSLLIITGTFFYLQAIYVELPHVTPPLRIDIFSERMPFRFLKLVYPYSGETRPKVITASYYGCEDTFNLKKRADGGIFNEDDMTAAHVSLPFGTKLRLINPLPGNFIWQDVVVNDGGPYDLNHLAHDHLVPHPKRQLDVSCAVAEKLGFKDQGITSLYIVAIPGEKFPEYDDLYSDTVLASNKRHILSAD